MLPTDTPTLDAPVFGTILLGVLPSCSCAWSDRGVLSALIVRLSLAHQYDMSHRLAFRHHVRSCSVARAPGPPIFYLGVYWIERELLNIPRGSKAAETMAIDSSELTDETAKSGAYGGAGWPDA